MRYFSLVRGACPPRRIFLLAKPPSRKEIFLCASSPLCDNPSFLCVSALLRDNPFFKE
jgi:hypothetical protein